MYVTKITISIRTEKELIENEAIESMLHFKARLEGYHTVFPEFLTDSIIEINKEYSQHKLKDKAI